MIGTSLLKGPFHLERESRFSYECKACKRCCQGKRIPLNPYEVARLAQVLGMGPDDVFEAYVKKHAVNFKRQESGYLVKDEHDSRHI